MTPQHQIVKFEPVKVWVTRLPSLSHPPLSMWRHRVTCLPPKKASALWGGVGLRWLTIIIWQVSYIQYLLACQKSQRSTPYNIVKCGLPWKRVFRRRHLGRRVTAVTCLRWPTVFRQQGITLNQCWLRPLKPYDVTRPQYVDSMWPSDTIWRNKSGSTLAQVMACCLMAPSHYLNQCWLIISKVQWHSSECNFTRDTSGTSHWNQLENYLFRILLKSPRGQWVK